MPYFEPGLRPGCFHKKKVSAQHTHDLARHTPGTRVAHARHTHDTRTRAARHTDTHGTCLQCHCGDMASKVCCTKTKNGWTPPSDSPSVEHPVVLNRPSPLPLVADTLPFHTAPLRLIPTGFAPHGCKSLECKRAREVVFFTVEHGQI